MDRLFREGARKRKPAFPEAGSKGNRVPINIRWLLALACITALTAGCQFGAASQGSPSPVPTLPAVTETVPVPTETQSPAPAATETPTATEAALVLSARTASESSAEAPKYTIDARWPYLEWGSDPRVTAFNQAAEATAAAEIRDFKAGVAGASNDPAAQDSTSTLKIDFLPTSESNGIFSVLYQISFYMAGAAHPGHYSHAINYDLRTGRLIELADLFQPNADYLGALSSACLEDLKSRNVLEWEDGALPKAENFQVWNITPQGLLITFDEYQVASYAAGPQAVMVPYETLKPLLRADGPLNGYIQP